jgi:S1-C subfamily serine protease
MKFLLLLAPLLLLSSPFHTGKKLENISSSVVKIFTSYVKPNYKQPWQMRGQGFSSGSGVIIEDRLILTSAHVVNNGVYIEVKKSSNPKRYMSHVKWISHEADLALLEINDKSFFKDTKALSLGDLPQRQDGVVVYGYPRGGNEISITQGIISRIEHTFYAHSDFDLLALQIDAAINPGNSGGPALDQKGDIVGIAMQSLSSSDNIGYLVPTPVIKHFLDDIRDGKYDGFPDDGLYIQAMENINLRDYYGMNGRTGVIITRVAAGSSCDGYLKKGDVLLSIDGIEIADDSTISMKGNGRVSANYPMRMHQIGESFELKILRNTREITLNIPLKADVSLVPYEHEKRPAYYIFGGMIFTPLTKNYLYEWGRSWKEKAPIRLVDIFENENYPTGRKRGVVILQSTLSDRENVGYAFRNRVVLAINDIEINSFNDFVKHIDESRSRKVKITLEGGYMIIMDKDKAREANQRLLKRYGIEHDAYRTAN